MLKWRLQELRIQIVNVLWLCTPKFIRERVQAKFADKKARLEMEHYMKFCVTEQDVAEAFDKLGIDGDVLVHSSLVHIGNIKGKHKPIANALQEHVLDRGNTVLAIGIPVKGSTEEYIRNISRFDKDEPIGMGVISTYYAKQEGACRSLNPTHSVIAYGPRAEEYTAMHHMDTTPFTEKSPYYKLMVNNGHILMVGSGIKHFTFCHVIEDMLGDLYPRNMYSMKLYPVDIYKDGECIYHGKYHAHSKIKGVMRVPEYVFSQVQNLPSTKVIPLGGADLVYVNARDAAICELEELRKGNSIYGWCYISNKCKKAIDECIDVIRKMPK